MMNCSGNDELVNVGVVHVTAAGLSKEIFGDCSGANVKLVREAIISLNDKSGFLRYYVKDSTGKLIPRIECSHLIMSYGVDITDRRIRDFNWVRLHPIFFSALSKRFIYNRYFTDKMSECCHYRLPSMTTMILFKYLSKFGNNKDLNTVQIYASKLMDIVCHREFTKRQISECRKLISEACKVCKNVGIINKFSDNVIGETGEIKYVFELNEDFFRNPNHQTPISY